MLQIPVCLVEAQIGVSHYAGLDFSFRIAVCCVQNVVDDAVLSQY